MTWYPPKTWTTGEVVSASDLNQQIRENILHLFNNNITFLGSPNTPYYTPGNWKIFEVATFMSATLGATNEFVEFPSSLFQAVVFLSDNGYVRRWDVSSTGTLGSTWYVVPPTWHAGTNQSSFHTLELNEGTRRLRLRNHSDGLGLGARSVRTFIIASAAPTAFPSVSGSAGTPAVHPQMGPGEAPQRVYATTATSALTFATNIERGESFELVVNAFHAAGVSVRLSINGDGGLTGWSTQLLAVNGTSVSGTRYSGAAYLYDATSAADRILCSAVFNLSGDGYVSGVVDNTYNSPTAISLAARSLMKNTTFTKLTTVTLQAAASSEFQAGSTAYLVRRCLY